MKSGKSFSLRLEKKYFDCIDERGNCFIIYRAELHRFFITIHYSELIFCNEYNVTLAKSSPGKTTNPGSGDTLSYINNFLKIRGLWKRIDNPLPPYLLRDPANRELIWICHHPKTDTEISYEGTTFRGYGYAETLLLTINPFDLPLNEIRWGRFLSDEYSVIWINWKGTSPLNKLYFNGVEFNDIQYNEESLYFNGGRYKLIFGEYSVVREGRLSSLFSNIPWIKIFIDKSILNTTENKYRAKSTLLYDQKISATGWSLYEIVTWKS